MATDLPQIYDQINETIAWLKQDFGLTVEPKSPLEYTLSILSNANSAVDDDDRVGGKVLTMAQARAIRGLELLCGKLESENLSRNPEAVWPMDQETGHRNTVSLQ